MSHYTILACELSNRFELLSNDYKSFVLPVELTELLVEDEGFEPPTFSV
jgi:hypothetical protein